MSGEGRLCDDRGGDESGGSLQPLRQRARDAASPGRGQDLGRAVEVVARVL